MTDAAQPMAFPSETIFGHLKKLHFFLNELSFLSKTRSNNLKILDFGCGNTEVIGKFIAKCGYDYYGVDFHKESLNHAKKIISGPNVHLLEAIPLEIEFDAILYGDVLEHLENPEEMIKEHLKYLVPGGLIIGAVPNGHGAFEIESALDRRFGMTNKFQWLRHRYYLKKHVVAIWVKKHILQKEIKPSPPLSEPIPFNHESGHIQFFSWPDIEAMFDRCGLRLTNFKKGVLMGGPFSGSLFGNCNAFLYVNDKLGAVFPRRMVSSWYFTAEKRISCGK